VQILISVTKLWSSGCIEITCVFVIHKQAGSVTYDLYRGTSVCGEMPVPGIAKLGIRQMGFPRKHDG